MSHGVWVSLFEYLQKTKAQTSLCIHAVWQSLWHSLPRELVYNNWTFYDQNLESSNYFTSSLAEKPGFSTNIY